MKNKYEILGASAFPYPVPGPWSYNPSYADDPDVSALYPYAAWGKQPSGQYGAPYAPYPFPHPTSGAGTYAPTFPAGYAGPQPIFVDNDDGTRTQVFGKDAAPAFVITDKKSQAATAGPIVDAPPVPPKFIIERVPTPPDLPSSVVVTDTLVPSGEGENFLTRRSVLGLPNWQIGAGAMGGVTVLGLIIALCIRIARR